MLRSYQQETLDYLEMLPSFGLFMGTGTGKTITSMYRVNQNPTSKLLIICPKNVIEQWKGTIKTWFPKFSVLEFSGKETAEMKKEMIFKNKEFNTTIVNYEIVHKLNLEKLVNDDWSIILDESHRIKSFKTKVAKACLKIGEKSTFKIILTATPTQGNFGGYVDYYTQLYFLGYLQMNYTNFCNKYVIEELKQFQGSRFPTKVIVGYKNKKEIDELLKMSCVRYEMNFGDFEPQHIKINFTKPKGYVDVLKKRVYKDIVIKNSARKRFALKTICTGTIGGLDYYDKQINYDDNTSKIDWIEDFLKDTNEVVAIYYQYNVELVNLEKLMKKLGKKYVVINGKNKEKYNTVNGKHYDVLLGQYQAASVGLDGLQHRCHIEILLSMPESSIFYKQVIGRIDRDGQTKVPLYYYLVTEGTIENEIYKMIEQKVDYNNQTLDKLILEEEIK